MHSPQLLLVKSLLFDFKNNLLNKKRYVIALSELKNALSTYSHYLVDWTGLPSILDSSPFETDLVYDALNRITEFELPVDLDTERKKLVPTYNKAGTLESVQMYTPSTSTYKTYVSQIAYSAKGQRLLIAYGNGMMTRYAYDTKTFRLLRQRSEKFTKSQSGATITYAYLSGSNKQDDGFDYDLIGNIVSLFSRVTDCGIGGTPDQLDRAFAYDPIYRLTFADGRESDTQNGNSYLYTDAPAPASPLPSNVRYYRRKYSYDKLGNITQVQQPGAFGFTRNYVYNTGNR